MLQNKALADSDVQELKKSKRMSKWNISYAVYNRLVTKLEFEVLFNVEVVRRMFKALRYQRLMALAPGIRFLRKLEMSAIEEVKSLNASKRKGLVPDEYVVRATDNASQETSIPMIRVDSTGSGSSEVEGWEEHMSQGGEDPKRHTYIATHLGQSHPSRPIPTQSTPAT